MISTSSPMIPISYLQWTPGAAAEHSQPPAHGERVMLGAFQGRLQDERESFQTCAALGHTICRIRLTGDP